MKPYLYGLLAVLFTQQTAFAEDQTTKSSDAEKLSSALSYSLTNLERVRRALHHVKFSGCNGFIRAGYIQTHIRAVSRQQAYGLGGELSCAITSPFFNFRGSAFAAINPGFNSTNKDEVHGDFFDINKNSYITLGEAVASVSYNHFDLHIGSQRINTPHMGQDDLRLLPNIFAAYLLDYRINDQLNIGGGFVHTAKGWENNGNAADFVKIGEAFGGTGTQSWLGWLKYQQGQFNANAWYYYIKDVQHILFMDIVYQNTMHDIFAYELGAQFDLGRSTGAQSIGLVDANTLGVFASVNAYGITFNTAYNKNFGQSAAVNSVGGGPFFTSMEQMTLDAVNNGKNAQAVLFNLEYQPHFLQSASIGAAAGDFQAAKATDFHSQELNAYLGYQFQQMFAVNFMYAYIKDLQSRTTTNQFRLILTYRF